LKVQTCGEQFAVTGEAMNANEVFEDRRLFPRLRISLYFEYAAKFYGSGESLSDWAVLKDISLTGLHFRSETSIKLQPGDIADFTFKFKQSDLNPLLINEIKAKGLIKRIEIGQNGGPHFDVVVEFLSGPVFKQAN
jgi:hypothetical protein